VIRLVLLAGCAALIAGCGKASAPAAAGAAPDDACVARELHGGRLALAIDGIIDNREPVPHSLPMPWIPIRAIAPDGGEVREGDPLVTLDAQMLEWWREDNRWGLEESRRTLALSELQGRDQLAALELRRGDLEANQRTLQAAIAATRARDEQQLAIARLAAGDANAKLDAATAAFARVDELHRAGHAEESDFAQARDARDLAEAATRQPRAELEFVEHDTASVTRQRLQLELAKVEEELHGVDGNGGVVADVRELRSRQEAQERISGEDLARREMDDRRRREVIEGPVIAARASGTVRYRDGEVRVGAKLGAASFVFVLGTSETIVAFQIPEALRRLIRPDAEDGGRVEARIDALGATLSGRILSVAAVPTAQSADARRTFACVARFDEGEGQQRLLDRLRPGMRARLAIDVPIAAGAAVVPLWRIGDAARPRARMESGEERELDGFVVGPDFIATSGLHPGERLAGDVPSAAKPRLRLSGVVEAQRYEPVRLASGGWELTEVVPDGARVEQGQVLARLSKSVTWVDVGAAAFSIEYGTAKARAAYDVARIDAEDALEKALLAWHEAAVDATRARLERLVADWSEDSSGAAAAEAALSSAEVAYRRAERAAQGLDDPEAQQAWSRNDIASRRLDLELAAIGLDRARLAAAAKRRERDWLAQQDSYAAVEAADANAVAARSGCSAARAGMQAALSTAQVVLRQALDSQRRTRADIADEVVLAPRSGRVYHRLQWGWKPLAIGDTIWATELFAMPIGAGRKFSIEVPARLYRRFAVGQHVSFALPALSPEPREGTVLAVAAYFTRSAHAKANDDDEKVFLLTVGFELPEADLDRAPVGTIAYVDL
jgi:multidrug efflux pump subunit AcrA (membrane-fusion protein)